MSTLPDDPVRVRWDGELRNGNGNEDVVLGTTDECVVFRSASGRLGTFPREHISSVESRLWTETRYEGSDYRLLVGGGAVLSTLAFMAAIVTTSGLLAFSLVLVAVGALRVADFGWKHRDEYDGIERIETDVERVTIHSNGGVHRQFALPVEYQVGARLSAFVRGEDPAAPVPFPEQMEPSHEIDRHIQDSSDVPPVSTGGRESTRPFETVPEQPGRRDSLDHEYEPNG